VVPGVAVVNLALVGIGVVGLGVDDGLGVAAVDELATSLFEQALPVIARPALPAKWSSCLRLTKFGLSSDWSGGRASIEFTITM
jgi:hypothetical protein